MRNQSLIQIANEYKGDSAIYIFTSNDRKSYRMPREIWVDLNTDIVFELKNIFGENNVKIVD